MLRHGFIVIVAVLVMTTAILAEPAKEISPNEKLHNEVKQAFKDKDYAKALAKAQALEVSEKNDKDWVTNTQAVPRALDKLGRKTEARTWISQKLTEISTVPEVRRRSRKLYLFRAVAAMAVDMSGTLADRKTAAAIALAVEVDDEARIAGKVRLQRVKIYKAIDETDNKKAEEIKYLRVARESRSITKIVIQYLPSDDVALCAFASAQHIVNFTKHDQREKTGLLQTEGLTALANQLADGGDARPLKVTDKSKALAMHIGVDNNPYLANLLNGNHAAAFRIAWANAKSSKSEGQYIRWIEAAAGAIRCHDQHYNGRAIEFVKFVNGEIEENPVADLMTEGQ
ncbi:MAG TPA: hypothetical protein ENL03_03660 [Phycisphaerae bacterium]|nr:hypothetical protein [Phycisphaerae bacterium]